MYLGSTRKSSNVKGAAPRITNDASSHGGTGSTGRCDRPISIMHAPEA